MKTLKGIREISGIILVVLFLISVLVSYAMLNGPVSEFIKTRSLRYALTIEVLEETNPDAVPNREVWINRLCLGEEEQMQTLFAGSEGKGFEYRLADKYGYSNDVITNIGGIGSTITFRWNGGEDDLCEFWKQYLSGKVRITLELDGKVQDEQILDLYSDQADEFYTYAPDSPPLEETGQAKYVVLHYVAILLMAALLFALATLLIARLLILNEKTNGKAGKRSVPKTERTIERVEMRKFSWKVFLRNFIAIQVAVLWSVASYIQWAAGERTADFTIPTENVGAIEIQTGDIFSQEIQINGSLDDLNVMVANGGGDRAQTNTGTIRLTLRQDDVTESEVVDIRGIGDWSYLEFPGQLGRFHEGSATFVMESLGTEVGSSLFIPYTGQDAYEIPPATYNGEPLPGPLVMHYETGSPKGIDVRACILGCLILLTVIGLSLVLTKYPLDALVYGGTVLLAFLIICLKYPSYTIGGEAIAEVAVQYIPSAENLGFIQNLQVLEAGLYLNVMGRLISWFAVHCTTNLRAAVLALNLGSLLMVSMMGTSLTTGALKKYFTPLESVFVSLLVITGLTAETIAAPQNTSCWGLIPTLILLAVIIFRVDISNKLYWFLGGMAVLSALSRMSFVIFIPILLFVVLMQRKQLTHRDRAFIAVELLACLIQGAGSLLLRWQEGVTLVGGEAAGSIVLWNPLRLLEQVFYLQVQFVNTLLRIRPSGNGLIWNILGLVALLGGCVFLLVCILKKRHRQTAVYCAVLLLVSFGQASLQLLSKSFGFTFTGWHDIIAAALNRQWVFCYIAWIGIVLLLFACLKLSDIYKRKKIICAAGTGGMALFLLVSCSLRITSGGREFYDTDFEIGDWKNYSDMALNETYVIPVAPSVDWMYRSSDCNFQIGSAEKSDRLELGLDAGYAVSFYAQKDMWGNQLSLHKYYISVYDGSGELAEKVPQISSETEESVGFDLDMPVNGISRLEFTYEDGTPAYINGQYLIGYRG